MVKKTYKSYKKLLDEKFDNNTLLILIIVILIISVAIFIPHNNSLKYSKNNILEIANINKSDNNNIVIINWKKYILYLEEVK